MRIQSRRICSKRAPLERRSIAQSIPPETITTEQFCPGARVSSNVPPSGGNFSAQFSGNSDSFIFNYAFPFQTLPNATLQFWVNPNPSAGAELFWTTTVGGDSNRFNIYLDGSSHLGMDYRAPDSTLHGLGVSSVALPFGAWSLIDLVKQGQVYSMYVNGLLASQVTDINPDLPTTTGWTIDGRGALNGGNSGFSGLLDDVRLFDQAVVPGAVPEPSTWAMMLLGFAGLGFAFRQRRRMIGLAA
jgi:hypothetical protein